jgi:Arc/MetJ family transcription regulator
VYVSSGDPQDATSGQDAPPEMRRMAVALHASMARIAQLKSDVQAGRVVMDPATGERLRTTLAEQADRATAWRDRARGLARSAPLGRNYVGQSMAGKFQRRADGDQLSFATVLDQYRAGLLDAHAAVDEAMRRYAETEQVHVAGFRRLEPS